MNLWLSPDGTRCYLIPTDIILHPGPVTLLNLDAAELSADPALIAAYEVDSAAARDWLADRATAALAAARDHLIDLRTFDEHFPAAAAAEPEADEVAERIAAIFEPLLQSIAADAAADTPDPAAAEQFAKDLADTLQPYGLTPGFDFSALNRILNRPDVDDLTEADALPTLAGTLRTLADELERLAEHVQTQPHTEFPLFTTLDKLAEIYDQRRQRRLEREQRRLYAQQADDAVSTALDDFTGPTLSPDDIRAALGLDPDDRPPNPEN